MRLWWNLIRHRASLLFIAELSSSNTPSQWAHINLRKSITDQRPPSTPPHLAVFIATCPTYSTHIMYSFSLDFSQVALGGMAGKWKIWKRLKMQGRCELTGRERWKWTVSTGCKWKSQDLAANLFWAVYLALLLPLSVGHIFPKRSRPGVSL